jgi:hypothetical protein
VFWVALGLVAILKFNFDYLLVVGIALVLNGANIVGYTKCRKGILTSVVLTSWFPQQSVYIISFMVLLVAFGHSVPALWLPT